MMENYASKLESVPEKKKNKSQKTARHPIKNNLLILMIINSQKATELRDKKYRIREIHIFPLSEK